MSTKSYEKALSLKEKGNACFKERKTADALQLYTEAIFNAPWPLDHLRTLPHSTTHLHSHTNRSSETLLAVCLGNRSATLSELKKNKDCLQDIELALKLGVSSSIEEKLERRKQNCLLELQTHPPADEQLAPLCSVIESECVFVRLSEECGRFVKAVTEIQPGEVIATERPFASVLDKQYRLTHCSFCFKEAASIIPCYWCTSEGYCSENCLTIAWIKYHSIECDRVDTLKSHSWLAQMSLRITAQAKSSDYQNVFSLLTHEDKLHDKDKAILAIMADSLAEIFKGCIPIESDTIPLEEVFCHHLMQLKCNTLTVSTLQSSLTYRPRQDDEKRSGAKVEDQLEAKLGFGLYSTLSLVNHSCKPNAIFRFVGNRASLCATRLIKAGEEVNISYGPQAGRHVRSLRQTKLKANYFFDCNCLACKMPGNEVQDSLLCINCFCGPLVRENESASYFCSECKHTPSEEELAQRQKMREKATEMHKKATEGDQYDLPLLLECLKLQNEVLHRDNMELAKTHDALALQYALQDDFVSSALHCTLSCRAVAVAYGEDSIELGNELFKLAQIHVNSGNVREALSSAIKAKVILHVYYGPSHPHCQELNDTIETLQNMV